MGVITIPRFAPITGMALEYDPELSPETENWLGKFVTIPNTEDVNFGPDQDFSIEVWVNPASIQKWQTPTSVSILEKWGVDQQNRIDYPYPYVIRIYNQNAGTKAGVVYAARHALVDGRFVDSAVESHDPIAGDRFHYLVFVKAANILNLYVDGRLSSAVPDYSAGQTANESPIFLGMRGNNDIYPSYFTGFIGQVRIWKVALPADTISQIWLSTDPDVRGYRDGEQLLNDGLLRDWRCNEGYGDTVFDYATRSTGGSLGVIAEGNDGQLGGGVAENKPAWVVSTILRNPVFIFKSGGPAPAPAALGPGPLVQRSQIGALKQFQWRADQEKAKPQPTRKSKRTP